MARFWFYTLSRLVFVALFPASGSSVINAAPQSDRVAGVFLLMEGGRYTLNFTAARAACLILNVTMATNAQTERALQRGLETCKYGWIAEQFVVVPRLTSDKNCGQGKTGLVPWKVKADSKYGVYCFNASDLEETLQTSKAAPQTSTSPASVTALTQTSAPSTAPLKSTPSRRPVATDSPEQTSLLSAFTPWVETTRSARISSTAASLKPSSTRVPTSLSRLVTSKPTPSVTFASSTSALSQAVSSAPPSLEAAPTALIILGVILLLLAAAGAVWHYKLNIFTFWSPGQQKDDTETEMWKHADSETDLQSQHAAEEEDEYEESDRKYSSDITLCVNPDIKMNSSE